MKPWVSCAVGMMIGSIVLIWSVVFKPHDLTLFQSIAGKGNFLCQKCVDIQK